MTHQTVGTNTATSSITALAVTINRPVAVGSTLLMGLSWDAGTGTVPTISSVVDSGSNTWTTTPDASIVSGTTVAVAVLRARVTTALVPGNTVTVTISAARSRWAAQVDCFDNLLANPLDKKATNAAVGASLSTGTTATTTAQSELVYSVYGFGSGKTVTGPSGLGMGPKVETSSGSSDRALQTTWLPVSSTGTKSSSITLDSSSTYAAAVATYKVSIPLPAYPDVPRFSPGTTPDLAGALNTGLRDPFTFLLRKPAFRARCTTAFGLTENAHQYIPWNQIDEDNYSGWGGVSESTRWYVPVSGFYLVTTQVTLKTSTAGALNLVLIPALSRNGVPPYGVGNPGWEGVEPRIPQQAGAPKSSNCVWAVYANEGDYLETDLWYSAEAVNTTTENTIGWQCSTEIVWTSI